MLTFKLIIHLNLKYFTPQRHTLTVLYSKVPWFTLYIFRLSGHTCMAQYTDQDLPQSPTEADNVHYTVFIRLPFPRGDFVDPPSVSFSISSYGTNPR